MRRLLFYHVLFYGFCLLQLSLFHDTEEFLQTDVFRRAIHSYAPLFLTEKHFDVLVSDVSLRSKLVLFLRTDIRGLAHQLSSAVLQLYTWRFRANKKE